MVPSSSSSVAGLVLGIHTIGNHQNRSLVMPAFVHLVDCLLQCFVEKGSAPDFQ